MNRKAKSIVRNGQHFCMNAQSDYYKIADDVLIIYVDFSFYAIFQQIGRKLSLYLC